jgi:hypothetical protein
MYEKLMLRRHIQPPGDYWIIPKNRHFQHGQEITKEPILLSSPGLDELLAMERADSHSWWQTHGPAIRIVEWTPTGSTVTSTVHLEPPYVLQRQNGNFSNSDNIKSLLYLAAVGGEPGESTSRVSSTEAAPQRTGSAIRDDPDNAIDNFNFELY